jgi:PS-10 peptidase S37
MNSRRSSGMRRFATIQLLRFVVPLTFVLGLCMPRSAEADELLDRLTAIPGLSILNEQIAPAGYRFFVLSYEQRVNHLTPWKGTFSQRLTLLHRSLGSAMVVNTAGYDISLVPSRSEPTQIVDGNELTIEHRFFLPSRPEPADWRDLTIFQAATDHHRLIEAFKKVYGGRWLTTGRSKGGMAAVYHRRFYPADVDGTIAYVAPNDVINQRDRYADFLDHIGTDAACRQRIKEFQRAALLRRHALVPMMEAAAADQGLTYSILGSFERAFEFLVIEWAWGFWQLGGEAFCGLVPSSDAPDALIYAALDFVFGFAFYSDQGIGPLVPLYYQQDTQLGYPIADEAHLADLLLFPGEDVPRSFLPAEIPTHRFDRLAMLDIDIYVRVFGRELMFVYGENDPWSAEPFRLGPSTRDSFWYVVPGANHGARIAGLPIEQQAEAMTALRRWAGLPTERLTPAPRVDSLDRIYEVEATRPRRGRISGGLRR